MRSLINKSCHIHGSLMRVLTLAQLLPWLMCYNHNCLLNKLASAKVVYQHTLAKPQAVALVFCSKTKWQPLTIHSCQTKNLLKDTFLVALSVESPKDILPNCYFIPMMPVFGSMLMLLSCPPQWNHGQLANNIVSNTARNFIAQTQYEYNQTVFSDGESITNATKEQDTDSPSGHSSGSTSFNIDGPAIQSHCALVQYYLDASFSLSNSSNANEIVPCDKDTGVPLCML